MKEKACSEATLSAKEKALQSQIQEMISGMDVARKLFILAREAGYHQSLSDIDVEPVLPSSFDSTGGCREFLKPFTSSRC